ncbi:MAG: hypothetical protein AAF203_03590, partial [Pseudomonadota bacterium]
KQKQVFAARSELDQFKTLAPKKEENPSQSQSASESQTSQSEAQANNPEDPSNAATKSGAADSAELAKAALVETSPQAPLSEEEKKKLQVEAEKLRRMEFKLEIALGLTIHDYFALYLKSKTREEVAQAVTKLDPAEVSELLMAYKKALYGLPIEAQPKNQNL